jgi:hypothetical protein
MTTYLRHSELPVIDFDFSGHKFAQLEAFISNLKLKDVESDDKFNSTLQTIKSKFLLKPVLFESPKIVDHHQTEKDFPSSYENPWGVRRKLFVIKVEIKFTGDTELFKYRPNGYSHGSGEPYVYQPIRNNISLEVETFNLEDKDKVFAEVQSKMSMTYQFVDSNNAYIKNWNLSFEPLLETKLRSHKEKLEQLYK